MMKKGAILLNLARGPVVDEVAVADALIEGRLSGVGLDVFRNEPLAPGNVYEDLENVMLSPHVSGGSRETFGRSFMMCGKNLARYFAGEKLDYLVNQK